MEYFLAARLFHRQAADGLALLVVTGVTARRQHHADGDAGIIDGFDLIQLAGTGGQAQLHQIGAHPQHDGLGLGVAEAAVELDHLGVAFGIDHQAGVEEAGVDVALGRHAAHRRHDHLLHHFLMHRICHHGRRGVGPHAAGVEAGVAVADPLVILAGGHGQHVLAVHHDDETRLFPVQELLDHHTGTGVAEGIAGEHVAHCRFRLFELHGDDDALACRQTVSLDDDGGTLLAQVGQSGLHLGEVLVFGGGDGVARQEVLGEGLGALQLGGGGGRAEDGEPFGTEGIHHPFHQGRFRPDYGETDLLGFGEGQQGLDVGRLDGDVLYAALVGGAGIAGGDEHPGHHGGLLGFPGQGVLTAAVANDQYFHRIARFYL
ncbi:hypothetical protein D3C76_639730 [compost metagenome]